MSKIWFISFLFGGEFLSQLQPPLLGLESKCEPPTNRSSGMVLLALPAPVTPSMTLKTFTMCPSGNGVMGTPVVKLRTPPPPVTPTVLVSVERRTQSHEMPNSPGLGSLAIKSACGPAVTLSMPNPAGSPFGALPGLALTCAMTPLDIASMHTATTQQSIQVDTLPCGLEILNLCIITTTLPSEIC